ncbi:3-(cis-5,6-dihydroxycyclohexa-1,3-dien-1-yl)propanoate dehydrogenase [Bowdeniella nasicola]|uniref:3-(Cis-5,6-dihydroxycyclohexa-1, 3-dien-1-yl)propanoate dehydrogenase n=1 Tax=Bowdeniella nasicola TaxID=208480 RepID=A0A1Q5Q035_9ACTO|nr:SDR family NAD(P)-dependent oxidoreductase [Bowdeniella nasicola]OKL53086.1 3-(cis-5,6-dihydroxycyclohexa-1,3-dien-1-yl)propanoate dehydrogenase [Bowdeniella nasicola]
MTARLAGKTALITGAASGLGAALADAFLAAGANVVAVDRDISAIHAAGRPLLAHTADVRDGEALASAVALAESEFGGLDICVPNAGIWDYRRSLTRLSPAQLSDAFDEVMRINVLGYLLTVQAALPALRKSGGSIVMTLSNAAFYPDGGGVLYTASKFAGRGLIAQLAHELAPDVRVNGVAVGGIKTGLAGPASLGLSDRRLDATFDDHTGPPNPYLPLPDAPTDPSAYVAPFLMLADPRASAMITGEIIRADGGLAARGFYPIAGAHS